MAQVVRRALAWTAVVIPPGEVDRLGLHVCNVTGMRRALAVKVYLVSLGVAADRIHTVSYGKEFPFVEGHTEAAWSKNGRAHFVITSK